MDIANDDPVLWDNHVSWEQVAHNTLQGLLLLTLTSIPPKKSNNIHYNMWDEIAYHFPNFDNFLSDFL